jgi:hypothetical protein
MTHQMCQLPSPSTLPGLLNFCHLVWRGVGFVVCLLLDQECWPVKAPLWRCAAGEPTLLHTCLTRHCHTLYAASALQSNNLAASAHLLSTISSCTSHNLCTAPMQPASSYTAPLPQLSDQSLLFTVLAAGCGGF